MNFKARSITILSTYHIALENGEDHFQPAKSRSGLLFGPSHLMSCMVSHHDEKQATLRLSQKS